jgi:ankyrin repeat protein
MELTGRKDTDLIVLSNLDDKSLLSYCQTSSYSRSLCKDENFWKNRFMKKWGNWKISSSRTWRNFYLSLLIYFNKPADYYNSVNQALFNASHEGDKEAVDFLIFKGASDWNPGIKGAASGGNIKLVEFFLNKDENIELDTPMFFAGNDGHYDIVRLLAQKGADVGAGLRLAVLENNSDLVRVYLEIGPNIQDLEVALSLAWMNEEDEIINILEKYLYRS